MRNWIQADYQNGEIVLSALGKACKYIYTPVLHRRVMECFESALRSSNRYFVLRGVDVIAAQSTKEGALVYYQSDDAIFMLTHDDVCNELFRRLDKAKDDDRLPILRLLKTACNLRMNAK